MKATCFESGLNALNKARQEFMDDESKLVNIFYLSSFFIFIILTTRFYFSDQNIRETNKSRSFYFKKLNNNAQNLPLLKNDTSDIIVYRNDIEDFKKKRKYYLFWDLIKK